MLRFDSDDCEFAGDGSCRICVEIDVLAVRI